MNIQHLTRAGRSPFIAPAAFERGARAKHYPDQVRNGAIGPEEAEADWQAWVAIELWIRDDSKPAWMEWDGMVAAAENGLRRREEACAADPHHEGRAARREAVRAILQLLVDHRDWLRKTTTALREDATAGRREVTA